MAIRKSVQALIDWLILLHCLVFLSEFNEQSRDLNNPGGGPTFTIE